MRGQKTDHALCYTIITKIKGVNEMLVVGFVFFVFMVDGILSFKGGKK